MQCRKHGLKTPPGGCGLSARAEQPQHRMVRCAFVGRAAVRGVAALWRGDLAHMEDAFLMMSWCICASGYVMAHSRKRASTYIFSMAALTHIRSNKCSHIDWLTWQNRPMCQSWADQQDLEGENHRHFEESMLSSLLFSPTSIFSCILGMWCVLKMADEDEKRGSEWGRDSSQVIRMWTLQALVPCADSAGNMAATLTVMAVGWTNRWELTFY